MTRARVKPELIRWVRKDAGLSVANAARRPIAIFYLAEPPWKFTALRDFRRLPGDPLADVIALAKVQGCVVITGEHRSGSLERPKIPDVCHAIDVESISLLDLIRREGWVFR